MTLLRLARRTVLALLAAAIFATSGFAQDGYRTPPEAITKILDSPSPPSVSLIPPH